jgi:hypothetical protein
MTTEARTETAAPEQHGIWNACSIRQQQIADERRDRDLAQAAYDDERADLRRELAQDRYGR